MCIFAPENNLKQLKLKTIIIMTKRLLTMGLTLLLAVTGWAADSEVYDFKGLSQEATINRGESLGFTVNNGSNRTIYSFSIAGVEMDLSRFGAFMGGATDGNFTLKTNGILCKARILSILNLKGGDKVTIEYQLASGGSLTLADATLIGNTAEEKTFVSGQEYTINTTEESVHLDIISSSNNNYIKKVTVTPYVESTDPTPSGDAVSVFLTAGQSNTAGRCMNDNLPDYIKTLGTNNSGAYQYCNWSYTNGSTRKSESEGVFRKFWPEMESASNNGRFAYDAIVYYWLEQALQKDFYVVKHAQGGTSIDPTCTSTNDYHWSADATWLAEHASCNTDGGTSMLKAFCDNIGKSLDALTTAGKTYDIKAMIWHQGESDRSGTGPDNYHDNLKAVVQYVRDYLVAKTGDSKYANLDFICGTVPKESKQYNKKVYDALFTLAQEDTHFHVIETAPGTFIGDQLHFDTNCAERLGIGMYNKMVDLGLVSGEKQTVPDAILPEGQPVTLDFKTWATENVGEKTVQKALTLSEAGIKALDGTTDLYKAIGCEAEGDFSEFAETFALSANEVKMRGTVGLQLASNQVVTLSILNLNPGDGVTITFGAGTAGATTLAAKSENIFVSDDATQTVLTAGTALTSKTVTYVVKSGNQIDLTFGSTGGHYINSIVIEPEKVEINTGDTPGGDPVVDPTDDPTTAVTIHTIGDSTMSHYDQSIAAQKGMDGWGDYLADCMKGQWTTVKNWADRGETAKSYYNGYWNGTKPDERPDFTQEINKEVNAGDYVIIQFGHNDSKAYDTATYEEWLGTLVDAVKAKGATPILAGSICRARFDSNGKITRLGRIDTGEENGVGEDDHTYDYPYHAQLVATAKGIEFIDVTTGVKEMFETYGEAKTKALFPSGEKTHTNKLGAQLIAKVAAKLLLGTALKNYVDQTTLELPAADDIDVVIDDFKSEATVTKKTLWTFNDVEAGTAISDGDNEVVNRNGLYVRGRADARAINAVASDLTSVTFSDNTEQAVTIMAQTLTANTATASTVGQNTAGRAAANALAPMFALNIATPGTFYAIMAPTKKATDRNINMFFSGKVVDSKVINDVYDAENHLCELKYHAETTGVIYIAAGVASNLYAAQFVPDMEAGTEEDWNYQMVKTRDDGYWTYCNRMPDNQKVPEGLTAYAVSSIGADGKAVLTDVGSVITPGMGVIVRGTPNTEYPMASTTDAATYSGDNLLVGNTTLQFLPATTGTKTNYYYENATTGFTKATGGETIHEKQAYLSVEATAETIALNAPIVVTELTTPTLVLKAIEGTKAVYTATFDDFATLHYQLGKAETAVTVSQSSPYDITISESDDITLWTTYESLTSESLTATIFAPTPAPDVQGYLDFSFAKQLPADLTVELDETRTIQQDDITYYYPTAMTATTFGDQVTFTKTGEKKKIYFRKDKGTLTIAKGKDMDMLLPGMKKNDMFSVTYTGTMTFANGDAVESGKTYLMESDTDLHLHLSLTGGTMAISKLTASGKDVLTAPTIKDKNKNLIEITAGTSLKGLPVTTCYTTDGSDPSMTNGTSGPYDTFEVEVQDHNGIFEVRAVSYTAEGTMSAQSSLLIYVSNIPSLTDDEQPDDDVPEIDYQQPEPVETATTVKYYISPSGSDKNDGLSEQSPFATLGAAQKRVQAGDIVYILPGTYKVTASEIAKEESSGPYKVIFDLSKSGSVDQPISYIGIPDAEGNRPVFDLSRVSPAGYRVTGFLVSGSRLLLKNFEVTGIRVNITDHTQSENIRVSDGTYNTFENIACHDGMGIGFYLQKNSAYNLIVNCDGYNNYDYISEEGSGDQNDAFGCHVRTDSPNNMFIGCRAWNNADDGFDLISCASPVTFSYSIAYKNGYDADGVARHDGNGFKAGGYGMSAAVTEVTSDNVPRHEVDHCLAAANRSNGIYSNHHLGGISVHHNTAYRNARYNYSFVNRKGVGADEIYDVDGYGHTVEYNLSVTETGKTNHVMNLNGGDGQNTIDHNSFAWEDDSWLNPNYGTSLFLSLSYANLTADRDANGMLSVATRSFAKQRHALGFGCTFDGYRDAIYAAREISGHAVGSTRGAVTDVRELRLDRLQDGRFYTLQGVEVAVPGKGMYIHNGRKIVIK